MHNGVWKIVRTGVSSRNSNESFPRTSSSATVLVFCPSLLNFELDLPIIGEERPIDMSNAPLQRVRAKQVRKALSSTYHRPPVQPLIPRSNLQLSKEAIMCAQRSLVRSPVTVAGLAVSSRGSFPSRRNRRPVFA